MKTKNKIGCFVMSRMDSLRLPRKALRQVKGKPILQHIIDRAKLVSSADVIVLCTSTNKRDDVLVDIAKANNIEFFRGSLKDVVVRFMGAADKFGVDLFTVFSGDNIFTDPEIMNCAISQMVKNKLDFINIPDDKVVCGGGCYCISIKALKEVCRTKNDRDTEFYAKYFMAGKRFRFQDLSLDNAPFYYKPNIRLTLDYPEDLKLVKRIFDEFDTDINNIPLKRIIKLMEEKPELININFFRHQDWMKNQIPMRILKD